MRSFRLYLQLLKCTNEAKKSLNFVQERHEEVVNLEHLIQEVHDLFLELALLVDAQVCKLLLYI